MQYHCPTCGVDHEGNDDGVPPQFCCKSHYTRYKNIKTRYRLTPKGVAKLFFKQKGRCKICKCVGHTQEVGNPKLPMLYIDHCHKTGKVRGLLCHNCNTALGNLKDTPSNAIRSAGYLSLFPCKDFFARMRFNLIQFSHNPIEELLNKVKEFIYERKERKNL